MDLTQLRETLDHPAVSDVSALISPEMHEEMSLELSAYNGRGLHLDAQLTRPGAATPSHSDDQDEAGLQHGDDLPQDANRRKVRHNLTERRRVDRMNQLFNRLAMAIVDEKAAPALTLAGAEGGVEGKDSKPKWSKADVLEGAPALFLSKRPRVCRASPSPRRAAPSRRPAPLALSGRLTPLGPFFGRRPQRHPRPAATIGGRAPRALSRRAGQH